MQDVNSKSHSVHVDCLIRQGVKSTSACKAGNQSMILLVDGRLRCVFMLQC